MPIVSPTDPELAHFLATQLGVAAPDAPDRNWATTAPVWIWRGNGNGPPPKAAWYFLTIDGDVADAIRATTRGSTGGFGSVRVTATIGATTWTTSLFPAKDLGGYLLPLKASVRKAERLDADAVAQVTLALADR